MYDISQSAMRDITQSAWHPQSDITQSIWPPTLSDITQSVWPPTLSDITQSAWPPLPLTMSAWPPSMYDFTQPAWPPTLLHITPISLAFPNVWYHSIRLASYTVWHHSISLAFHTVWHHPISLVSYNIWHHPIGLVSLNVLHYPIHVYTYAMFNCELRYLHKSLALIQELQLRLTGVICIDIQSASHSTYLVFHIDTHLEMQKVSTWFCLYLAYMQWFLRSESHVFGKNTIDVWQGCTRILQPSLEEGMVSTVSSITPLAASAYSCRFFRNFKWSISPFCDCFTLFISCSYLSISCKRSHSLWFKCAFSLQIFIFNFYSSILFNLSFIPLPSLSWVFCV